MNHGAHLILSDSTSLPEPWIIPGFVTVASIVTRLPNTANHQLDKLFTQSHNGESTVGTTYQMSNHLFYYSCNFTAKETSKTDFLPSVESVLLWAAGSSLRVGLEKDQDEGGGRILRQQQWQETSTNVLRPKLRLTPLDHPGSHSCWRCGHLCLKYKQSSQNHACSDTRDVIHQLIPLLFYSMTITWIITVIDWTVQMNGGSSI